MADNLKVIGRRVCPGIFLGTNSFVFFRFPPNLDQVCSGSNYEECIEGGVNDLHQTENELGERDQKSNDALSKLRLHCCFGIRNHEEHKQLIHRTSNRCDLCGPRMACNPAAKESKREKGNNVSGADVETSSSVNDYRTQDPNHEHRCDEVTPLNAQTGNCFRA